jgi:hypothetical protein
MLMMEPAPVAGDVIFAASHRAGAVRRGPVRFVGSGKAALAVIFGYLQQTQALENKMASILVPSWLGTWVYHTLHSYGFPTLDARNANVVMCYHQYGFPQKLDRVLDIARDRRMIVVEDCAHACASLYGGRPVGTVGDFSAYSYSKFAFCFALGGVASVQAEFYPFLERILDASSTPLRVFVSMAKLADEWNIHRERPIAAGVTRGLTAMAYSRYAHQTAPGVRAVALWLAKEAKELQARRDNYRLLRNRVDNWGICDHLEADGVVPYAVPLAVDPARAPTLVQRILEAGVEAGIRRFDYARCVFEPDYRPSVLVPIHSQMTGRGMDVLLGALRQTL